MLTKEEIKEIKNSEEYKDAFSIALKIHQDNHDRNATNFNMCIECKSGFALLLLGFIEKLEKEYGHPHSRTKK